MNMYLIVALFAVAYAKAPYIDDHAREIIPNEYIVQLKDNTSIIESQLHLGQAAKDPNVQIHRSFRIGQLSAYHMTATKGSVDKLLDNPMVKHIEPNQVMRAFQSCMEQQGATWGIVRTQHRELDLDGLYAHPEGDGEGVDAYIIDTGIYLEHNSFDNRAVWGVDTVDTPSPETDGNGHGTHVAGTVLGDIYGLARSATGIAVKVLSAGGSGSTAGVIQGIEWVTDQHKSKSKAKSVANMSLGGGRSTTMNSAVDESVAAGVVHVVAAGNENQDACNVSPASAESAITVACSNNRDMKCSFSNYGTCVNMIAPGEAVTSAWKGSPFADNTISGTSMSAPHVAGAAVKVMASVEEVLTPKQVLSALSEMSTKDEITGFRDTPATPNHLVFADCPLEAPIGPEV